MRICTLRAGDARLTLVYKNKKSTYLLTVSDTTDSVRVEFTNEAEALESVSVLIRVFSLIVRDGIDKTRSYLDEIRKRV